MAKNHLEHIAQGAGFEIVWQYKDADRQARAIELYVNPISSLGLIFIGHLNACGQRLCSSSARSPFGQLL